MPCAFDIAQAFRQLCAVLVVMLASGQAAAKDWVLVEGRLLPQTCADPLKCDARETELMFRNLLSLSPSESDRFKVLLNSLATIRRVPDTITLPACHQTMTKKTHPEELATKFEMLAGHPGVFFDSTQIDGIDEAQGYSTVLREELAEAGVRFLTKAEWERTPGRPTLSLRYSVRRESAGCIIPFAISLNLQEEVLLLRDLRQKTKATVWSGSARQNLASTNATPRDALDEIIRKFLTDWSKANPKG